MLNFLKKLFRKKALVIHGYDIGKKGGDKTVYMAAEFTNGKLNIINTKEDDREWQDYMLT